MKRFLLTLFVALFSLAPRVDALDWKEFSLLAIQDRGRIKPLDTMATESIQFITGKRSWSNMTSSELIFEWLVDYENGWDDKQFIRVDYGPLKKEVGLEEGRKYYAPSELASNQKLGNFVRAAARKQQAKETVSETEKKALRVQNQLGLVRALADGRALTILPNPKGLEEDWFPLAALASPDFQTGYTQAQLEKISQKFSEMVGAYKEGQNLAWTKAVADFKQFLATDLSNSNYPSQSSLKMERHYNHLRPFKWSWILYLFAFLALLIHMVVGKQTPGLVGGGLLVAGFLMHTYGITLRCLIGGRPPVTNMYESIIWVSIGTVFFAGLVWLRYRQAVIPCAAAVFSMVSLVLGDNLPVIFDPGIHPLEPVLRSNFWLTIHVLTITLSYAAFALSLCMGNVVMGYHVFAPRKIESIQYLNLYMYRAMQIGVVLLAIGTILGGVWADYSWGRFWGWDPKEVWALIALLLYIAVLHGRFAGWLRGFGFTAATVVSFLGVLMAWYGVNFVLGVGLHSYGFGTGGMGYITSYVVAQLVFIGFGYFRHVQVRKELGREPSLFPKTS